MTVNKFTNRCEDRIASGFKGHQFKKMKEWPEV